MRPPGWLLIEKQEWREGILWVTFRVRKWHPGFWVFLVKTLASMVFNRKSR